MGAGVGYGCKHCPSRDPNRPPLDPGPRVSTTLPAHHCCDCSGSDWIVAREEFLEWHSVASKTGKKKIQFSRECEEFENIIHSVC